MERMKGFRSRHGRLARKFVWGYTLRGGQTDNDNLERERVHGLAARPPCVYILFVL